MGHEAIAIEKRHEARLKHSAAVFVEACSEQPDSEGSSKLILCKVVDISANGLQLRIDRSLPQHAVLALAVKFPGLPSPLKLVGEVRWSEKNGGDDHVVGFALYESLQTDISDWKEWVAETLSDGESKNYVNI